MSASPRRAAGCASDSPGPTCINMHLSNCPASLTPDQFEQALKNKTRLPLATVLRCRIRYFTDGAVLGGKAFVAQHLAHYRHRHGRREQSAPRPLPALTDWGADITSLRGLRNHAFGP